MFKLNTPFVVIDLEATAGKDARGFQTNDEIIDLGAVYLDEALQPQGEFSSLVRPEAPITEFITKLTGITPAMTADKPDFEAVGGQFVDWVKEKAGNVKKIRLAAWGNYFDIPLLRRNYQAHGREFPFAGTALDVKTLAILWLSHSGRRTDKVSLEELAGLFGINPGGAYHRALTDARVTAGILVRIWKEMAGIFIPGKEGEPYRHFRLEP